MRYQQHMRLETSQFEAPRSPLWGEAEASQSFENLLLLGSDLELQPNAQGRSIQVTTRSRARFPVARAATLVAVTAAVLILSPSCREAVLVQGKAALGLAEPQVDSRLAVEEFSEKVSAMDEVAAMQEMMQVAAGPEVYPAGPDSSEECGLIDKDTDYHTVEEEWFDHIDHVSSLEACCDLCRAEERCNAWTWVEDSGLPSGNPGQCWRKGGVVAQKVAKKGVISGYRIPMLRKKEFEKLPSDLTTTSASTSTRPEEDTPEKRSAKEIEEQKIDKQKIEDAWLDSRLEALRESEEAWRRRPVSRNSSKPNVNKTVVNGTDNNTKKAKEEPIVCAGKEETCLESKCCKAEGHQCYTKDVHWAACMADCVPGPHPTTDSNPVPWECKALGNRTAGKAKVCSKTGQDCSDSMCCADGGLQCYEKNETWAECRSACTEGLDYTDSSDWSPWTCEALGERSPGPEPWVATVCARENQDCTAIKCCADPNHQCYKKNKFWAECKPRCDPEVEMRLPGEPPWECLDFGERTPPSANGAPLITKVAPWVLDHCKIEGENCMDAKCCHAVGARCYAKNEFWASCKTECNSTSKDPQDNSTWSCEEKGNVSPGLATRGWPSLYCITIYMPSRYEGPLMRQMLGAGAGIFQCDGYDVFSQESDTLGVDLNGAVVKAFHIPNISVGVSQDGTAGNAKLFMAMWDKVISGGRHRDYDWTIKVDPDAVIIPWRVRNHMRQHTGENVYVVNCNKFPDSPNFPMMYGAVEIFSNKAMIAYAWGSWRCGRELDWKPWGEDYYMTHCLDFLGVGRIGDFLALGDDLCTGANCADFNVASYHPFKNATDWFNCWKTAVPTGLPPP